MTAALLQFGPRQSPIRIAKALGVGALLFGAAFLALGILIAGQGAAIVVFFVLIGMFAASYGVWMYVHGLRMARLRAAVTESGLHLVAHVGRHLVFQRGLAEAAISWGEIQGISDMRTLNMNAPGGTQTTYILYTSRGDFTLNDTQWDNLAALVREISVRTGRKPGTVSPERSAAVAQVQTGKRRVRGFQRAFGWTIVILCAPLLLLVILGAFLQGFSGDLMTAASFLLFAIALGAAMIRYYRN